MLLQCGFDPLCYIWSVWASFSWEVHWLVYGGMALLVGGTLWNLSTIVKKIAGWPGVAGLVAFGLAIVVALNMRTNNTNTLNNNTSKPIQPTPPITPIKKRRKTIFGSPT